MRAVHSCNSWLLFCLDARFKLVEDFNHCESAFISILSLLCHINGCVHFVLTIFNVQQHMIDSKINTSVLFSYHFLSSRVFL